MTMLFLPTEVSGAWLIEPELISDERGSFGRTWCAHEFEQRGLNPRLVQCNISTNRLRGTVRGMHFQPDPHAEAKLVRCTRGAIYDVIVDLRPDSATAASLAGRRVVGGRSPSVVHSRTFRAWLSDFDGRSPPSPYGIILGRR